MTLATFSKRDMVRIWGWYGALVIVILLPMLLPGYILTLDLVFTPHIALPTEVTNTYPLQVVLWLLHFVMPGDLIEKIMLFAILVISGAGMHILIRSIRQNDVEAEYWNIAACFGGIFYTINPFTYARFMAGQWMVLLGYALLPLFLYFLLKCIRGRPTLQTYTPLTATALLISCVSVHFIGMVFLLSILAAGVLLWQKKARAHMVYIGGSAAAFLLVSLYWLIPIVLGRSSIGSAVSSFGDAQFQAYQTTGGSILGMVGQVIRLQGFWAEARQLFVLPQQIVPLWGVIVAILWIIVVLGAIRAWHRQKVVVSFSLACIVLGVVLSATPITAALSHVIPFIAGYREPQKFTALIAMGYALLGACGTAYILQRLHDKKRATSLKVVSTVTIILPILITPVMLWGFSGQLQPRQYPPQWYEMNDYMKRRASDGWTLFLPWHEYANYSFSGRIIANPAEKFFEVPIVSSDDPELNNAPPTVPNKEKAAISASIKEKRFTAADLGHMSIHYVLIANEQDYQEYGYIIRNPMLQVVHRNSHLTLYKVRGA